MSRHLAVTMVASVAASAAFLAPAAADPRADPASRRVLDCEGTTVVAHLTPGGFGTPFHVVDSTAVLLPKHVEVVFPGETEAVVTLSRPGFDRNAVNTLSCTYTDPAGLFVAFDALVT